MNLYDDLRRTPSRRDLLSFGLIFATGMGVIGALQYFYLHEPERALWLCAAGGVVLLLSQVPRVGRWLYVLWMGLGLTIGFFTRPILLFVVYALLVVPVGLWFKVRRRDAMRRMRAPGARSYWEDYPGASDPASYVRQF